MPVTITEEQARAWETRYLAFCNARIEPKETALAMTAAGLVLGKEFREDFTTTIPDPAKVIELEQLALTAVGALGASVPAPQSVIYMPAKHRALPALQRLPLLGHEGHHAWLNQQGWPKEPWFYAVSSESRVEDEVQCIVVAASLSLRLTGSLPDPAAHVASLVKAYHLGEPDGPLARELLAAAWLAFGEGARIPPTPAAVEAHRILDDLGVGWA